VRGKVPAALCVNAHPVSVLLKIASQQWLDEFAHQTSYAVNVPVGVAPSLAHRFPPVPVTRFGQGFVPVLTLNAARFPLESIVAADDGVCDACNPAPVMIYVLVRDAALVTHVAQAIVPVKVIVPPVIGEVVAMLVTVPLPAAPHCKSH
jgi:hypothetical protein